MQTSKPVQLMKAVLGPITSPSSLYQCVFVPGCGYIGAKFKRSIVPMCATYFSLLGALLPPTMCLAVRR